MEQAEVFEGGPFFLVRDRFFAEPHGSVLGWERAIDAQSRIVNAVQRCIAQATGSGDICIFSHGGVGTLLLCSLRNVPISREEGQPIAGGGCYFTFS